MSVSYVYKDFKSIINKLKLIDSWFWCRYTLNPYNGCEFACTYCDSRSHKYHLHPSFDQDIFVKTNVGVMLDNRITRARTLLPDVVAIGGTCDAYQPAEAEFGNTRKCLEVLLKHHYPVCFSTKSPLILRDLDLLSRISEDTWCAVGVTVTTLNEEMASFLEPNAPDPTSRLQIIRTIKEKAPQIHAGINLMPIVPFLGDSADNLESIVREAKNNGADYILAGGGMTMRDKQAEWFLGRINEKYPRMVERFAELYGATYDPDTGYSGNYGPRWSYAKKINRQVIELCEKYQIDLRVKRYIPDDFRKLNYMISEMLLNEAYLAQIQDKPWNSAVWAGQNIQSLSESIADVAARGELQNIRNVGPAIEKRMIDFLNEH
ncbi:MAG: radical SAM protein [Chloroflexi bacterium]|jgi:DNA repair photolyase|nr:radical SAM protein [Chloroflexota bacterium]